MEIRELLNKKNFTVETINGNDKLTSAITKMNEKHIGALVVVKDNGDIDGILSERDLLKECGQCTPDKKVKELMTPGSKLITLKMDDSIETAMRIFTEKRIRHLPVLKDGKLAGIISIGDAVKELLEIMQDENTHLKGYIMGQD